MSLTRKPKIGAESDQISYLLRNRSIAPIIGATKGSGQVSPCQKVSRSLIFLCLVSGMSASFNRLGCHFLNGFVSDLFVTFIGAFCRKLPPSVTICAGFSCQGHGRNIGDIWDIVLSLSIRVVGGGGGNSIRICSSGLV